MNMRPVKNVSFILTTVLLAWLWYPQTVHSETEPPTRLTVRTLKASSGSASTYYVQEGETFTELRISTVQPSSPVVIPYTDTLFLYSEHPNPTAHNPEEQPLPTPVYKRVPLPEGATEILLLLLSDREGGQFVAIREEDHPRADNIWRLLNTTRTPIALKMGAEENPVLVPSRKQVLYRNPNTAGISVSVWAAAQLEGKPRIFYSTYWPIQAERRYTVLFAEEDDHIQVRLIGEHHRPSPQP